MQGDVLVFRIRPCGFVQHGVLTGRVMIYKVRCFVRLHQAACSDCRQISLIRIYSRHRSYLRYVSLSEADRKGCRLKSDVFHVERDRIFKTEADISEVFRKYMPFYNQRRLYSGLGYMPPAQYEAMAA